MTDVNGYTAFTPLRRQCLDGPRTVFSTPVNRTITPDLGGDRA
jgi:hypothetical protein